MESQDTFVATAGTLSPGAHPGGFNGQDAYTDHPVPQSMAVRRLLPVECERLQAFPDGWTEPAGADGPRYRCLGNAVTSSVAFWIGERMRRVHEGEEVNRPVDVAGYIERLNA